VFSKNTLLLYQYTLNSIKKYLIPLPPGQEAPSQFNNPKILFIKISNPHHRSMEPPPKSIYPTMLFIKTSNAPIKGA
jgi:hypothetical protein